MPISTEKRELQEENILIPVRQPTDAKRLEVVVIVFRKRLSSSVSKLLLVPLLGLLVDCELGRLERRSLDEGEVVVAAELARQPEEWLFEVVVRLGGNIVVLQILLAVEGDLLGLDLAVLDFYLVAAEHNRDVLAHTGQVAMPVGHVLVGDARRDVEHDYRALPLDVVSIAKASEFLLSSRVPDVELDGPAVGVEKERVHFDAQGRNVLLLELASQVTLHKRGFSNTTVAHQDELELGNSIRLQ